ncbi:MAG: threonine synthase, partial [Acidaminococcaceae bacterium]|nr:threonine synthase [Acidaminococcaceae bacterium]
MLFVSTRGQVDKVSSAHAIKEGLAGDGGLFVPQTFPYLSPDTILGMHALSYEQCAAKILGCFLTDYTAEELAECTASAYSSEKFGEDPAPLRKVGEQTDVLELWHGPTMAFKDIALQILPRLMTKAQEKTGSDIRIVILVATSGDTGKAALEGFADVPGTEIIVFYPEDGVSQVQKLQMVTQTGRNTKVFGIRGNFDDAQRGVKEIFGDAELAKELKDCGWIFSSANSINWGRLVPQITYYFKAYADAVAAERIRLGEKIIFSVPTGNFGDILAGYYAKKMGLPVKHFICASNSNNVLTDFINSGVYDKNRVLNKTVSPSMDILVSSNLERLLFDLTDNDAAQVAEWMQQLNTEGKYQVTKEVAERVRDQFFAAWIDEGETIDTIGRVHNDFEYL